MAKEIYISTTPHETRLAIVEDEQLAEIYYERENEYTLAGSIYNGKVTRVLPGMQSSFVDIGLERDAFLYVTDFMEEQGDADFDAESTHKPGPSREDARPEGRGERRSRSDRERPARDRNRAATEPVPDTQSFDEPVAPHPIEVSAAEAIADEAPEEQGSRRWRGRRGRRRGRNFREGESVVGNQTDTSVPEASSVEVPETFVLEDSSFEEETQALDGGEWAPELPQSEADAAYALRRSTRREEIRRGRKRFEDVPVQAASLPGTETVQYDQSSKMSGSAPFVLPGESIRKYRDPEEVANEESTSKPALVAAPATTVASSFEVVGWDGGAVLPGETLSRHRRQDKSSSSLNVPSAPAPAPAFGASAESETLAQESVTGVAIPQEDAVQAESSPVQAFSSEEVPATEAPEETGGLTHENRLNESEAPSPRAWQDLAEHAKEEVAVPAAGEYEPEEGESASLGDVTRRDLRRLEQRSEPEQNETGGVLEELVSEPDATTYDLLAGEQHSAASGETTAEERNLPAITEPGDEHDITTLQASGDMVSEPIEEMPDGSGYLPVSQDEIGTYQPQIHAGNEVERTLEGDNDEALSGTPSDFEVTESALSTGQTHAYGEGDLEEEELDGDEYEYDLTLAAVEEEELDEYEEETLDDTADLGSVLHEMVADDRAVPVDDVEGDEFAPQPAGMEFTVEDFGGEPEENADSPASEADEAPQEKRRGRQDGRRFGRERRPGGGFRGGSGGDRGRGRQSVQTMDLPAINELLKPGQEILVQIAKEPIAKKGARITSHIALPGRFLVFMPTVNHTGVSRKISSDEERRRLKSILLSEKGEAQGGFIVRTAADGASEEELRNDLRFLIQLWQDIKMRSESSKSPALIYHDLSLVERILRDQVTDNFSAIWVDTESEYERVLRFLQRFQPSLVRRVKLYTKETPLFEHFGVTQEIDRALKSKVWLKSGGSIVINQTEALVAIDINTGKYVGKTARLEDTILKTNLDAIPEIVRQIRLRDLGGIIVIDFIDMDERKNRSKVMQVLEDELKSDRAPSKVLPFNDFGLVIMTRKRVKQSLERTLCIPDPVTEGTGMIKSPITVANEIYVEMRKMYRHIDKGDLMLRVHPEVVKQLKASGGKRLQELEDMTRKTILVKSDPALNPEQFDIH